MFFLFTMWAQVVNAIFPPALKAAVALSVLAFTRISAAKQHETRLSQLQ